MRKVTVSFAGRNKPGISRSSYNGWRVTVLRFGFGALQVERKRQQYSGPHGQRA